MPYTANGDNLQIGDRVRLNSGGPMMTVTQLNDDDTVIVTYENRSRKIVSDVFPAAALTRIGD